MGDDDTVDDAPGPADAAPRAARPTPGSGRPRPAPQGASRADGSSAAGSWRGRRTARKQAAGSGRRKAPWWEFPALVLLAVAIAILVKTFVVQPFYIPSQSMERTLHGCPGCRGDRILVNKPIYDFRDPHPGDIVVFHAPSGWDDEPVSQPPANPVLRAARGVGQLIGFVPPDGQVLVKRVIATGGQTVRSDAHGNVSVSAHGPKGPFRTLHEPYVYNDGSGSITAFPATTVPQGRLWVMGDHRNDSSDSRFHCGSGGVGGGDGSECPQYARDATVPIGNVIGKAFVIAWPPSRWRTLGTPSTFEVSASGGAPGLRGLPGVPGTVGALAVLPIAVARRRRRAERDGDGGRRPARPRRFRR